MSAANSSPPSLKTERKVVLAASAILVALILWMIAEYHPLQIAWIGGALAMTLAATLTVAGWRKGWRWLMSRRAASFYLWVLMGLVSVLVLFYTEESWRGKRALAGVRREASQRGESLELASILPPQVPDEENFAMAPGVMRVFQIEGKAGTAREERTFYHGSPSDWPDAAWTRQKMTDLAQWHQFLNSLTNAPQPATSSANSIPDPAQAAAGVLAWLRRFESDIEVLQAAATRPKSRYPIDYEEGWGSRKAHTVYQNLHHTAHALCLRASAELAQGDTQSALQDLLLVLRLAETLRQEPFASAHRTRAELVMLSLQPVWEGMARQVWSEEQLVTIQKRLASLQVGADWQHCVRGEVILLIDMASQLNAYLSGHNNRYAEKLAQEHGPEAVAVWLFKIFYPRGWLYQDQAWAYRFYRKYGQPEAGDEILRLPRKEWLKVMRSSTDPFLAILAMPRLFQVCEDAAEWRLYFDTIVPQALAACAIERYRLAKGQAPHSLAELVPTYLDRIPADPAAGPGKELTYRKTGPDTFVLYSMGLNRRDDGGTPSDDHRDWRGMAYVPRLNRGDWVWGPPVTNQRSNSR